MVAFLIREIASIKSALAVDSIPRSGLPNLDFDRSFLTTIPLLFFSGAMCIYDRSRSRNPLEDPIRDCFTGLTTWPPDGRAVWSASTIFVGSTFIAITERIV